MRKYMNFLLLICLTRTVLATTFVPISIKKQLKESSGLVVGEVVSISFEKDKEEIFTKIEVYSDKWIGLEAENDKVSIYYPGGEIDGMIQKVEGTPSFKVGEKVVLLTKRFKNKNFGLNLALGKFSIIRVGSKHVLINEVFPKLVNVGQISLEKFFALAQRVKQKKLKERLKDKYEISKEKQRSKFIKKKNSRSIASVSNHKENKNTEDYSVFWLLAVLSSLGFFVRLRKINSQ